MQFIGVDLGWHDKPTGLAHLKLTGLRLDLVALTRRTGTADVLTWIDERCDGPAMIAVDAPLIIANAEGMRPVDRQMHHHFGKYHAGCYPASLSRPYSKLTTSFSQALLDRGFLHAAGIVPRQTARYQIEVYPHAANVHLFDLQHILCYKKGPVAGRRTVLLAYRKLISTRLRSLEPAFVCDSLPRVPSGGSVLKELEDELDAIVCAYVGAHWWYWGHARNTAFGDAGNGYIVVPNRNGSDHI